MFSSHCGSGLPAAIAANIAAGRPLPHAELPISGEHALAVDGLPPLHKDPFDRILIAQSMVESVTLLTSDPLLAQYPGPIRKV